MYKLCMYTIQSAAQNPKSPERQRAQRSSARRRPSASRASAVASGRSADRSVSSNLLTFLFLEITLSYPAVPSGVSHSGVYLSPVHSGPRGSRHAAFTLHRRGRRPELGSSLAVARSSGRVRSRTAPCVHKCHAPRTRERSSAQTQSALRCHSHKAQRRARYSVHAHHHHQSAGLHPSHS